MEASTQPQPALPAAVSPLQTPSSPVANVPEAKKESKVPLIISVVLVVIVLAILAILLLLSQNKTPATNINNDNPNFENTPVSAPATQTTTAPETSTGTTPPSTNTSQNTFEGRLFYVGFDYKSAVTADTTTRITNDDGTTKCFQENASGDNILITINQGDPECLGAVGGGELEKINETTKDGKSVQILIDQDGDNYKAVVVYVKPTSLAMSLYITLNGKVQQELKTDAIDLVNSLTFDTTQLKTELTDKII